MCKGTIEHILTGNKQLSQITEAKERELQTMPGMSSEQREKIVEILDYIKRQASLRKQRLEFQLQIKKTEELKEELEKSQQDDANPEN
jgi:DNA repair protein RadC